MQLLVQQLRKQYEKYQKRIHNNMEKLIYRLVSSKISKKHINNRNFHYRCNGTFLRIVSMKAGNTWQQN